MNIQIPVFLKVVLKHALEDVGSPTFAPLSRSFGAQVNTAQIVVPAQKLVVKLLKVLAWKEKEVFGLFREHGTAMNRIFASLECDENRSESCNRLTKVMASTFSLPLSVYKVACNCIFQQVLCYRALAKVSGEVFIRDSMRRSSVLRNAPGQA